MKKMLFMLIVSAITILSCKKDNDQPIDHGPAAGTIEITVDAGFSSQTVNPPKQQFKAAQWILKGKNTHLLDGILRFSPSSDLSLNNIQKVRVVIREKDGSLVYDQLIAQTASSQIMFPIDGRFSGDEADTLQLWYEVPNTATKGTLAVSLEGKYAADGQAGTKSTGPKQGQSVTFSIIGLSTMIDATTPQTMRVSGDQLVTTNKFKVTTVGSLPITAFKVVITDPSTVESIHISEGTTGYASTTAVSGTTILTVPATVPMNNETRSFSAGLKLKPVTNGQSGANVKTSVAVQYKMPDGTLRWNDTLRTGNDVFVYRAVPTVVYEQLTGTITNGTPMNTFKVKITAPPQGSIAIAQMTFPHNLVDNGSNDTLINVLEKLTGNGTVITSAIFVKGNGDTTSKLVEGDQLLHTKFGGSGEYVIPAGTTVEFVLSEIPQGYDKAESDAFSTSFNGDNAATSNRFKNGGTSGQQVKLASTPSPTASAQVFYFIWSDMSSVSHSAIPGLSSSDWFNGHLIVGAMPNQVWYRSAASQPSGKPWTNSFK